MIGDENIYQTLLSMDSDFRKLFKIKVEFEDDAPKTVENMNKLARFVKGFCDQEELSPLDKQYLSFGKLFEQHFLNQGFDANRSIEETLDLGWDLVSVLPREALDRLDNKLLDEHYDHDRAVKRFHIKEKSIIKELQEAGD